MKSCTPDNDCTGKSCLLSSFIWQITLYQAPTITREEEGSESDTFESFRLWQQTANASELGKVLSEKFHVETESTPLNWSVCAFSEFLKQLYSANNLKYISIYVSNFTKLRQDETLLVPLLCRAHFYNCMRLIHVTMWMRFQYRFDRWHKHCKVYNKYINKCQ